MLMATVNSRIQRFSRWIDNEHIDLETYFAPYAQLLLTSLAHRPLVLVMDVSAVGRKMCHLDAECGFNRALPLGWIVLTGNKGHFSEQMHLTLLEQVYPLIPVKAQVIFLGDGEFDGVELQQRLEDWIPCSLPASADRRDLDISRSYCMIGVEIGYSSQSLRRELFPKP